MILLSFVDEQVVFLVKPLPDFHLYGLHSLYSSVFICLWSELQELMKYGNYVVTPL